MSRASKSVQEHFEDLQELVERIPRIAPLLDPIRHGLERHYNAAYNMARRLHGEVWDLQGEVRRLRAIISDQADQIVQARVDTRIVRRRRVPAYDGFAREEPAAAPASQLRMNEQEFVDAAVRILSSLHPARNEPATRRQGLAYNVPAPNELPEGSTLPHSQQAAGPQLDERSSASGPRYDSRGNNPYAKESRKDINTDTDPDLPSMENVFAEASAKTASATRKRKIPDNDVEPYQPRLARRSRARRASDTPEATEAQESPGAPPKAPRAPRTPRSPRAPPKTPRARKARKASGAPPKTPKARKAPKAPKVVSPVPDYEFKVEDDEEKFGDQVTYPGGGN